MPYNRHRSKARTATRRARAAKRSGNRYKANRYKRQARTQQRKARQFDSRSRAAKRAKANNTRHNYSSSSRNNNYSSSLFRSNNTLFGNSNNNYSSNYRSNNHITYGNGRRFKQFGNTRSAPQRIYHPTKTFEYIVNVEFLPEPTILSMMDTTGDGIADSAAIDTTGDGMANQVQKLSDQSKDGFHDSVGIDSTGDGVCDTFIALYVGDGSDPDKDFPINIRETSKGVLTICVPEKFSNILKLEYLLDGVEEWIEEKIGDECEQKDTFDLTNILTTGVLSQSTVLKTGLVNDNNIAVGISLNTIKEDNSPDAIIGEETSSVVSSTTTTSTTTKQIKIKIDPPDLISTDDEKEEKPHFVKLTHGNILDIHVDIKNITLANGDEIKDINQAFIALQHIPTGDKLKPLINGFNITMKITMDYRSNFNLGMINDDGENSCNGCSDSCRYGTLFLLTFFFFFFLFFFLPSVA